MVSCRTRERIQVRSAHKSARDKSLGRAPESRIDLEQMASVPRELK
jgi:hypothetical protein